MNDALSSMGPCDEEEEEERDARSRTRRRDGGFSLGAGSEGGAEDGGEGGHQRESSGLQGGGRLGLLLLRVRGLLTVDVVGPRSCTPSRTRRTPSRTRRDAGGTPRRRGLSGTAVVADDDGGPGAEEGFAARQGDDLAVEVSVAEALAAAAGADVVDRAQDVDAAREHDFGGDEDAATVQAADAVDHDAAALALGVVDEGPARGQVLVEHFVLAVVFAEQRLVHEALPFKFVHGTFGGLAGRVQHVRDA
mmetsp:Transcript_24547/g.75825  ORF Transcript_24547/g.75825 Transcript_24547/m.75825 type:complete len:249 (+) Transcript_24547:698-1444(+)